MKRLIFVFFAILFTFSAYADGWRKEEMEVKVFLKNQVDYETLHKLRLNGDIGNGYAVLYLIPSE
ncbi:MAG: hypothetical protein K8R58_08280, partial [Bacteroidales bacterium]|nr:hypothetical protein [Bacteroidales bacterium]